MRLQGTAWGNRGEALGDVADEFFGVVLLDGLSQLGGAVDLNAVRQGATGIDGVACFLGAEAADGVEVLQTEVDRINLVMA